MAGPLKRHVWGSPQGLRQSECGCDPLRHPSRHSARAERALVHPWRVLHAATANASLLALVMLQSKSGMRPQVVTLSGPAEPAPEWAAANDVASGSLLSAWHDVRTWRDVLASAAAEHYELVHAHSFSAGMAAVRNYRAVAYELDGFVEQLAVEAAALSGSERPGAWLSRSLRVAEQFVIARAGAVIVHDAKHREGAIERGAAPDDVFVIARDTFEEQAARLYDEAYHHAQARRSNSNPAGLGAALTLAVQS